MHEPLVILENASFMEQQCTFLIAQYQTNGSLGVLVNFDNGEGDVLTVNLEAYPDVMPKEKFRVVLHHDYPSELQNSIIQFLGKPDSIKPIHYGYACSVSFELSDAVQDIIKKEWTDF